MLRRALGLRHLHSRAASRIKALDPRGSVFAEFTPLSDQHGAVNLGQGFPNLPLPDFLVESARAPFAAGSLMNQYARSPGHPRLVNALSAWYSPRFGRTVNANTEVLTTAGATEALYAAIQSLVGPGDEVLLMEPFYDSYPACVHLSGATPVFVPLTAPSAALATNGVTSAGEWRLDMAAMEAAITPRTKMLILNTPHNPIGKVFTMSELESIAAFARKHDLLVISDEVYETIVYDRDRLPHHSIATLPGMWERTLTVGSVGKTFSVTGWKVGWLVAHPELVRTVWMAHQFITFAVNKPAQEAIAAAFEYKGVDKYFADMTLEMKRKRDFTVSFLQNAGLAPYVPDGSYFVVADASDAASRIADGAQLDARPSYNVCKWLTSNVRVAAIPVSAFYSEAHAEHAGTLARFCFCKTDDMLEEAAKRLGAMALLPKHK